MAATQAKTGFGTEIKIGNGVTPTEAFLTIGELVDVGELQEVLNMVDATHMQSPNGYGEKLPTFKQTNPLSLNFHWVPADTGYVAADLAFNNRRLANFKLIFPTEMDRSLEFQAWVGGLSKSAPHDNVIGGTITLEIQGKPVLKLANGGSIP